MKPLLPLLAAALALPAVAGAQVATPAAPAPTAAAPTDAGTIAQRVATDPTLSTLARTAKLAGLDTTLAGPGPITVFAPADEAFGRLAPGNLDALTKPANKASLTKLLSYHVVAGRITLADLQARTQAGGGSATLQTLAGQPLTVAYADGVMSLADAGGNKSYVKTPDVAASNGVIHVVNGVLLPKLQ